MRDFFKFMFASMLGFFLTSLILLFLFFGFIMTLISFAETEEVEVKDNSILHLKLDYPIEDRTPKDPMKFTYNFQSLKMNLGLNEILKSIDKAKNDDRIAGIYLDLQDVPSGLTTISDIRDALINFKESGKFVYMYGTIVSQKAYYLGTAATKIFLNPKGFIDFRGFHGEVVFIKGLLEKLDIKPQVIRHGKYKSAVEPFIMEKMSEESKEQTLSYIDDLWTNTLSDISTSRNISIDELNRIADGLLTQEGINSVELKIADSLLYMDEFLSLLSDEVGVEHIKRENLITLHQYHEAKVEGELKRRSKNKIAVVYASGTILQGEGNDQMIGSDRISRTIRQARLDNSVKAVVLRVNSPGGDAIASDIILREMNLTKREKPVIVSMGDIAASGGYYIACSADKILAHSNTITGSIGVFGVIPNLEKMFENKLGITFDGVKTNENADFLTLTKPLSEYQYEVIKNEIEDIYETFVKRVAEGRDMTYDQVDELGQGRVWSGMDALANGLVDELGDLDRAVEIAVEMAGLEDYRIVDLPEQKDPFVQLVEDLFGGTKTNILQSELGENYQYYQLLKEVSSLSGIQARLPYHIEIN